MGMYINVAADGSPVFTRDTGYRQIYGLLIPKLYPHPYWPGWKLKHAGQACSAMHAPAILLGENYRCDGQLECTSD